MYPEQSSYSNPSAPVTPPQAPLPTQGVFPQPPQKHSKKLLIIAIILGVTTLGAAGLAGWAVYTYTQEKSAIDTTVASAESEVRRDVVAEYDEKFLEFQKEPNAIFAGPDDYGRLTFEYPRFWSVHVAQDAVRGGDYEAYLNPGSVPPISAQAQFGLRVLIEDQSFERVISSYQRIVEDGALTSRTLSINDETATRFDGNFSDDIRGSAVVFRIRDKTVTLRTDAQTFRADFDKIIGTINFNR